MIPKKFWEEIEQFDNKIILVSGGVDSTFVALEFFKKKIKCSYLHNDTGLVMKSSRETLKKLYDYTKTNVTQFHVSKASDFVNVREVLDQSFENLSKVDNAIENENKYERKYFYCCTKLKKEPMKKYCKKNFSPSDTILIRSDLPIENRQRYMRLAQLRKQETFIKYLKSYGFYYGFPLRDFQTKPKIKEINNIKSSGCSICPVVLLFRRFKEDPESYIRSKKYLLKYHRGVAFCSKIDDTLDEYFS